MLRTRHAVARGAVRSLEPRRTTVSTADAEIESFDSRRLASEFGDPGILRHMKASTLTHGDIGQVAAWGDAMFLIEEIRHTATQVIVKGERPAGEPAWFIHLPPDTDIDIVQFDDVDLAA
jgi:hypothetical protein